MTPDLGLDRLSRPSRAVSRSISAENPTGGRGAGGAATEGRGAQAAGGLGRGWKISPCIEIGAGATATIAAIEGAGTIRHVWLTAAPHRAWRGSILRIYWDGEADAAVEVPLGDFFCQGWNVFGQVSSATVAANPNGGLNCYWPMPFQRSARVTVENVLPDPMTLYYQVDYELDDAFADSFPDGGPAADAPAADALYFHAQWRRSNPVPRGEVHTLLDGLRGCGHYVGTYLAWGVNSPGWWGEGEVKFYFDGDTEFPTICGTGTEDYFGGAWNFDVPGTGYTAYTTPYLGLHQVLKPDGLYRSQQRFGMYRWHIPDPVRFREQMRVTIQCLGSGPGDGNGLGYRYRPNSDDLASTAFFYLDAPSAAASLPPAPTFLSMEVD